MTRKSLAFILGAALLLSLGPGSPAWGFNWFIVNAKITDQFGNEVYHVHPGEDIYLSYSIRWNEGFKDYVDLWHEVSKYKWSEQSASKYCTKGLNPNSSSPFIVPPYLTPDGTTARFKVLARDRTLPEPVSKYKSVPFVVDRWAYINATRTAEKPMTEKAKVIILNCCTDAGNKLNASWLQWRPYGVPSSANADVFLGDLRSLRPNVVLIHAQANLQDGGRIYFPDDSYINADKINKAGPRVRSGLVFAAGSETAYQQTLANAFLYGGYGTTSYDAFIGFSGTVPTKRNAQFYKRFFTVASRRGVSAAAALENCRQWALTRGWTDVYNCRLYGDGDEVFLGGAPRNTPAAVEAAGETAAAAPLPGPDPSEFVTFRELSALAPGAPENVCAAQAEMEDAVQLLRSRHGAELRRGVEIFPNFYRVVYRLRDKYLYGVDFDKTTGQVIHQDELD